MARLSKIFYFNKEEDKSLVEQLTDDYALVHNKTISGVVYDAMLSEPLLPAEPGRFWIEEMYLKTHSINSVMAELLSYISKNLDIHMQPNYIGAILDYYKKFIKNNSKATRLTASQLEYFCVLMDCIIPYLSKCYDSVNSNNEQDTYYQTIPAKIVWLNTDIERIRQTKQKPIFLNYINLLSDLDKLFFNYKPTYSLLEFIINYSDFDYSPKSRIFLIDLIKQVLK